MPRLALCVHELRSRHQGTCILTCSYFSTFYLWNSTVALGVRGIWCTHWVAWALPCLLQKRKGSSRFPYVFTTPTLSHPKHWFPVPTTVYCLPAMCQVVNAKWMFLNSFVISWLHILSWLFGEIRRWQGYWSFTWVYSWKDFHLNCPLRTAGGKAWSPQSP